MANRRNCAGFTRRDCLQFGLGALAAGALPDLLRLRSEAATTKHDMHENHDNDTRSPVREFRELRVSRSHGRRVTYFPSACRISLVFSASVVTSFSSSDS